MAKRAKRPEPFGAGMYEVDGRLFSTRDAASAYCKANRISAYKIGLCPPPKVDLDVLKLSVREDWTLRTVFHGNAAMMLFEHADKTHGFTVPLSALVDLVSTVKARVRELAQAGELL